MHVNAKETVAMQINVANTAKLIAFHGKSVAYKISWSFDKFCAHSKSYVRASTLKHCLCPHYTPPVLTILVLEAA